MMTSQGWNNFQLSYLGKIARNLHACDMLSCNNGDYLTRRQNEWYIIIKIKVSTKRSGGL